MLKSAQWYKSRGFWPIPIKGKRPLIKWAKYQTEPPEDKEISEWWDKWPEANIGLITGKAGGLLVVDIDTQAGKELLESKIPESFQTPISKTPGGGWHYYFKYRPGLQNKARVADGIDVRTDGGYIVAPPSQNGGGGSYSWLDGLSIAEVPLSGMDDAIYNILYTRGGMGGVDTLSSDVDRCRQVSSSVVTLFKKGSRDEDLFRLANHLVKSGMDEVTIRNYLNFCASNCNPPFPKSEINIKIESALNRQEKRENNLSDDVREFVLSSSGVILSSDVVRFLNLSSRVDKQNVSKILSRMVGENLIERYGSRHGQFRVKSEPAQTIDFLNAPTDCLDIKYPLAIENHFRTTSKNIIVIAGTQDAGKTGFLLRFARMNLNRPGGLDIKYMSSEMGGQELADRLRLFGGSLDEWKEGITFVEKSSNFQDEIESDSINIIDYLEISDNFYQVAGVMREIFDRLKKGIAVIAIQKDFKNELGRGGSFSLEKPRLYLTLTSTPPEGGIAKIVKCKNWKTYNNPNGKECNFKIRNGCEIRQLSEWEIPQSKTIKRKIDNEHSRKDLC